VTPVEGHGGLQRLTSGAACSSNIHRGPAATPRRLSVNQFYVIVAGDKCKKLQFIHKLTASDTSKTAKITKR